MCSRSQCSLGKVRLWRHSVRGKYKYEGELVEVQITKCLGTVIFHGCLPALEKETIFRRPGISHGAPSKNTLSLQPPFYTTFLQ